VKRVYSYKENPYNMIFAQLVVKEKLFLRDVFTASMNYFVQFYFN